MRCGHKTIGSHHGLYHVLAGLVLVRVPHILFRYIVNFCLAVAIV